MMSSGRSRRSARVTHDNCHPALRICRHRRRSVCHRQQFQHPCVTDEIGRVAQRAVHAGQPQPVHLNHLAGEQRARPNDPEGPVVSGRISVHGHRDRQHRRRVVPEAVEPGGPAVADDRPVPQSEEGRSREGRRIRRGTRQQGDPAAEWQQPLLGCDPSLIRPASQAHRLGVPHVDGPAPRASSRVQLRPGSADAVAGAHDASLRARPAAGTPDPCAVDNLAWRGCGV